MRALTGWALGPDAPAVKVEQAPRDGEPEAGAAVPRHQPPVALEDALQLVGGDARAGIAHDHMDARRRRALGDGHPRAGGGVAVGVDEQVDQYLTRKAQQDVILKLREAAKVERTDAAPTAPAPITAPPADAKKP